MPYISEERRQALASLVSIGPEAAGELNYCITDMCLAYIDNQAVDPNYSIYNAVIGALESAKLEFYRRAIAPYETQKMFENGDVGYDQLTTNQQ